MFEEELLNFRSYVLWLNNVNALNCSATHMQCHHDYCN